LEKRKNIKSKKLTGEKMGVTQTTLEKSSLKWLGLELRMGDNRSPERILT
jgi:hypothetical protein